MMEQRGERPIIFGRGENRPTESLAGAVILSFCAFVFYIFLSGIDPIIRGGGKLPPEKHKEKQNQGEEHIMLYLELKKKK